MGRYINWDDVIDRFPELNTLGGADELSSSHIVYAEAFVDGALATHYTVPFSNNNMIVKDLAIDVCYWRAARFKFEDATSVKSAFFQTVDLIKDGHVKMIDASGTLIPQIQIQSGLISNVQSYHSAFGMSDPIDWDIDQDQKDDAKDH